MRGTLNGWTTDISTRSTSAPMRTARPLFLRSILHVRNGFATLKRNRGVSWTSQAGLSGVILGRMAGLRNSDHHPYGLPLKIGQQSRHHRHRRKGVVTGSTARNCCRRPSSVYDAALVGLGSARSGPAIFFRAGPPVADAEVVSGRGQPEFAKLIRMLGEPGILLPPRRGHEQARLHRHAGGSTSWIDISSSPPDCPVCAVHISARSRRIACRTASSRPARMLRR